MALESRREVDTVLDTMLRREPAPQIAALNEQGLFVAMPASVPIREGCLIEGPTSGMQLVVASDIPVVIDTWARALLDGVASAPVQLLNSTGAQAELWIIDARHRYDVLLCLVIVPIPAGENAAPGPRVWNSTKDQLAVITDVDPSVREILGWRPDELIGRRSTEFIHPEDIPRATTLWMKMLGAPGARQRSRLRHLHRDGSWMWFEFTNHNRLGETGYGCVQSKMTEVGDLMAEIDPLTGSLNRSSILAALDGRLEAPCAAESGTAVILIHLDRLKRISDLSGYAGTDELLRQTSERLLDNARGEDAVGRLSDDEFLLVCDVSDEAEAAAIAERIGSALREIVEANSLQIEPTVSIGVAWTNGGMTAEELVAAADAAIHAKAGHHHSNEVFRSSLRKRTTRKLRLQTDLRHAINRDELSVWYQPIVDLGLRRITGFEALLRWEHRDFGPISPLEAIPIAEDSGLIGALGNWVLREACARTRRWQVDLPACDALTINVNVSPTQFRASNFVKSIDSALVDTGLPPSRLHIEVTESLLIDDLPAVTAILGQIRQRGIQVHIDDFGTGYSSLAYLDQFPVDVLKIDKSFVSGTADGLANAQIVETIIELARQLGIAVTAEGIETAEQERLLRALSCAKGQGYLFSKALPAQEVPAYLALWRSTLMATG